MSSSAPDVAESRRAAQKAEQEPESEPQRKWVALVSAAVLLGDEEKRAKEIVHVTDMMLELTDPPQPSYLLAWHPTVAPEPRRNDDEAPSAYILAADRSACILLQVVEGNRRDFFLCDTHSNTVTILPPASSGGLDLRRDLSVGLIADPHHDGHYVVAQLHPTTYSDRRSRISLVYYSTAKGEWFSRAVTLQRRQERMRNPFSETGVLAHDGRLWWFALAYGVFVCEPFSPPLESPRLRFLPLPDDCEMEGDDVGFDPRIRTLIDQRRCVRPSEGKLRFVEIRGLSYDEHVDDAPPANPTVWMWTLDDPEGPNPWTLEYEVAFAEIWDNKTYADAGLLPRAVPHVALVDPNDHYVVYFFQGSKLFGLDMREKKVVACKECLSDRDQLVFRSSRPIVDAWELPPQPPTLPGDHDSSPDNNVVGSKLSGLDMREKKVVACKECLIDRDQHMFLSSRSGPIVDSSELPPPPPTLPGDEDPSPDDNVSDKMKFVLAESGLGFLCRRHAFCSICLLPVCLYCCPDHQRHHGAAPGAIVRICMTKDGAAVNARDIKVNTMGYNWQFIQRKMCGGQKCIMLNEPQEDMRNKDACLQCRRKVKSKSRYCSAKCKALRRPSGQNTHVVSALVQCDFDQPEVCDRFCDICKRAFASAHCADHEAHHHEQAAAAPAPSPEAIV